MEIIYLTEGKINCKYKVISLSGDDNLVKRLEDLGFTKGTEVTVLNKTKTGIIIKVLDSAMAMDNSLAKKIIVRGKNKIKPTETDRQL